MLFFSFVVSVLSQLLVKFKPTVESAILGIQSRCMLGPTNQCSHQI